MNAFAKHACIGALLGLLLVCGGMPPAAAADQDLDYQRLSAKLQHLADDPQLGQYAQAQRARARQALNRMQQADDDARQHWLYMAKRRIDLAYAAAQLEAARLQQIQLQREHDRIMLEAARQEAAQTRRELEQIRIQKLAAQEAARRLRVQSQSYASKADQALAAAEQARAEAQQAKKLADARAHAVTLSRKQAELAEKAARMLRARMQNLKAEPGPKGMHMILGSTAFATGEASLQPEVTQHLGKLVQFVNSSPDKPILIEGYTDSSGSSDFNAKLSRQRAASVRDALVAAGVDAARIQITGYGEAHPVASNETATGRAQNRRVVVILKD